jgi:hypothetical protein
MTAAGTWPFPPGRALNGWWRDLSGRKPHQLGYIHLLLHRVEALADVTHTHRPDEFELALLRLACAADGAPDNLRVDRQLLARWLSGLADQGLLRPRAHGWDLTDAGRAAVTTGAYTQAAAERRTFYFVDQRELQRPAEFLPLTRPALPYPTPGADFWFDPHWLEECLHRPPQWKQERRFPADVEAVRGATPAPAPAAPAWREIVLDRPEHLPVALIQTAAGVEGYQAQPEDWKLRADEPAFTLGEGWQAVLPELAAEPPPELWRAAFGAWCRQRSLPPAEADAAVLRRHDYQLEARLPARLIERLRAARSDVFHGEAWLLAGTGRARTAACLKVVEGA